MKVELTVSLDIDESQVAVTIVHKGDEIARMMLPRSTYMDRPVEQRAALSGVFLAAVDRAYTLVGVPRAKPASE